ncbi:MAG: hypothetical protein PF689_07820 [Deltaproteobacteria bacterium]|jgi:hypothetical protein|nr:hypothetical protein [Deltaproteobacteria bacterium]
MTDNRNPIRRSLTGGLSLGLFSGLFLVLPDLIKFVLHEDRFSWLFAIISIHLAGGIMIGGIVGIFTGLTIAAGNKFTETRKDKELFIGKIFGLVFMVLLIFLLARVELADKWKLLGVGGTIGLFYFSSSHLVEFVSRLISGYRSKTSLMLVVLICLSVAFAMNWLGILYFNNGFYWEGFSQIIALGGFFLLNILIRILIRKKKGENRGLSFLATPKPVAFILLLGAVFAGIAKYKIKDMDSRSLKSKNILASYIIFQSKDTQGKIEKTISIPENDKIERFNLKADSSLIIITQSAGKVADIPAAANYEQVVLPSPHEQLILASFFTGNHWGIRAVYYPHLHFQGKTVPEIIKFERNYNLYNFSPAFSSKNPWLAAGSRFGFPLPFPLAKKTRDRFKLMFESLNYLKRPYLVWLHLKSKVSQAQFTEFAERITVAQNGKSPVIVYLSWKGEKPHFARLQIKGKDIEQINCRKKMSLLTVLPGLLKLGSRNRDQGAVKFPDFNRIPFWIANAHASKKFAANRSVKSLFNRVKNNLKGKFTPAWYLSSTGKYQYKLKKLEEIICRGFLLPQEKRRVDTMLKKKINHPQVDTYLQIANSFSGNDNLPLQVIEYYFDQIENVVKSSLGKESVSTAKIKTNSFLFNWLNCHLGVKCQGRQLEKKCPGIVFQFPSKTSF